MIHNSNCFVVFIHNNLAKFDKYLEKKGRCKIASKLSTKVIVDIFLPKAEKCVNDQQI